MIRVYVALMASAQRLFEKYDNLADPWMTLAGYFNSIRELAGTRRLVEDDIRTRLRDADQRGLAKRQIRFGAVEELTSRKTGTDIPKILERLELIFDKAQDAQREADRKAGKQPATRPYDAVLATNMISVGVDIERLGLMAVAGQPKNTSEYIQATSRVGRSNAGPGLVVTLFNWARPRDLSHYETFEHYHETFYKHVEALSVTPFSARALDRGLSGVLVALMRLRDDRLNANIKAGDLKDADPADAGRIRPHREPGRAGARRPDGWGSCAQDAHGPTRSLAGARAEIRRITASATETTPMPSSACCSNRVPLNGICSRVSTACVT